MPLNEFWHGDIRLLGVYQKAYMREKSYNAWVQGQYNLVAFSTVMANAFAKKGDEKAEYPNWTDPMAKFEKPKITKDNLEEEFRKQQANEAIWLRNMLRKE